MYKTPSVVFSGGFAVICLLLIYFYFFTDKYNSEIKSYGIIGVVIYVLVTQGTNFILDIMMRSYLKRLNRTLEPRKILWKMDYWGEHLHLCLNHEEKP